MLRKGALRTLRTDIIGSVFTILLGCLTGCLLWTRLPPEIAVHFTFDGCPDSWAPKAFTVFGLPLIMLGFQLLCLLAAADMPPQARAFRRVTLWIVPIMSVWLYVLLYVHALGGRPDIPFWTKLMIGTVLILLGNWGPKGGGLWENHGFIRWRLSPADRLKTVRFTSYCRVLGGTGICFSALSGSTPLFAAVIILTSVLPFTYALLRSQGTAGRQD